MLNFPQLQLKPDAAAGPCSTWRIATFRCDAEFDRYRNIANMAGLTAGSTPVANDTLATCRIYPATRAAAVISGSI